MLRGHLLRCSLRSSSSSAEGALSVAEFAPNSATFGLCSLRSFGAELLTSRMVQDGVYVECAVGGGHLQSRHSLTDVCSLSSKVSMSRSPRSTRPVSYQSS